MKQGQCSSGQPVAPRGQGAGRAGGDAAQAPPQTTPPTPAAPPPPPPLSGQIGQVEDGEALRAIIKIGDWNQFQVIARGNTLIHLLNGHVTAVFRR